MEKIIKNKYQMVNNFITNGLKIWIEEYKNTKIEKNKEIKNNNNNDVDDNENKEIKIKKHN